MLNFAKTLVKSKTFTAGTATENIICQTEPFVNFID